MKLPETISGRRITLLFPALLAALVLALGWLAAESATRNVDAELRQNLLRQTMIVARQVNPNLARKLSFTAADQGTPAYERLCAQMRQAGQSFAQRGIYSMALRDGKIVFGPENYPPGDPQASPPGTVYEQPTAAYRQIFSDQLPLTEGPSSDEFGTFVSAIAPVLDPVSGELLMVVGVDIAAGDWQDKLLAAKIEPLLLTLALLVFLAGGAMIVRWRNRRARTNALQIKSWIVAPTTLVVLAGGLVFYTFLYRTGVEDAREDLLSITEQTYNEWERLLANEIRIMKARLDGIATDPLLLKAWRERDLATLNRLAQIRFKTLQQKDNLTHFNFIDPDRTSFLRVHQPERRGDRLNRSTLMVAEETGEDAWGVEVGSSGELAFRYVYPWRPDGVLLGYLELGVELETITKNLAKSLNLALITALRKQFTSEANFELGRPLFGFIGQWNSYRDFVVAHQVPQKIPAAVNRLLAEDHSSFEKIAVFDAQLGAHKYDCGTLHLSDPAGMDVADLIIMKDVTARHETERVNLLLGLGMIVTLSGGVIALLWSITGAAEQQLADAFSKLRNSEASYRRQFADNRAIMFLVAPEDGQLLEANDAALSFYGYTREKMLSMRTGDLNLSPPEEIRQAVNHVLTEGGGLFQFKHRLADGSTRDVEVSVSPIMFGDRRVLHSIIFDISARKQAEKKIAGGEPSA